MGCRGRRRLPRCGICASVNPGIHQGLLAIAAALREVDETLAATTFLTVKARVARALLELAEHIVFPERICHGDLAAMAGVARENVSRVLGAWRRRKFLTGSVATSYIINIAALKREMNRGGADRRTSVAGGNAARKGTKIEADDLAAVVS